MNLYQMIANIKKHPEYERVGMILCHNGVVRGTSRNGRKVTGLMVSVDHDKLNQIITENKQHAGIIDIQIDIAEEKKLTVGDDVMFLVVAGNIRENVISALEETLNAVKTIVTRKTEYFA